MLFILFQLGQDRYALEAAQVVEVLPLLAVKQLPLAVAGVAGVINYRNAAVPVLDLIALTLGRPAAARLDTRIVLVHYADRDGEPRLLGLIAEKVNETLRCDPARFQPSGIDNPGAPYLGPVAADARGVLQLVDVAKLLPASVRDVLFTQTTQARESA